MHWSEGLLLIVTANTNEPDDDEATDIQPLFWALVLVHLLPPSDDT